MCASVFRGSDRSGGEVAGIHGIADCCQLPREYPDRATRLKGTPVPPAGDGPHDGVVPLQLIGGCGELPRVSVFGGTVLGFEELGA